MVHVITQFYKVNYKDTDKKLIRKRQDEITRCFKINLNHSHVEKIHFLYEKQEDVDFLKEEGIDKNHEKIVLYNLESRMKYSFARPGTPVRNTKRNITNIYTTVIRKICTTIIE